MPAEPLCGQVAEAIPAFIAGDLLPANYSAHIEQCLVCQSAVARDRRLLRLLGELSAESLPIPSGLVAEVLHRVAQSATQRAMRSMLAGKKVAYLGGLVIALLGAGGVVVVAKARGQRTSRPAHRLVKPPTA